MTRSRDVGSLLAVIVLLATAGAARAQPTLELVWVSSTGSGTPGSSLIEASNGDTLVGQVRLTAGPEGIAGYAVSLEFDQALDDELDLVGATGFVPAGFDTNFLPNPSSTSESSGSSAGSVYSFNAISASPTPAGPSTPRSSSGPCPST